MSVCAHHKQEGHAKFQQAPEKGFMFSKSYQKPSCGSSTGITDRARRSAATNFPASTALIYYKQVLFKNEVVNPIIKSLEKRQEILQPPLP